MTDAEHHMYVVAKRHACEVNELSEKEWKNRMLRLGWSESETDRMYKIAVRECKNDKLSKI